MPDITPTNTPQRPTKRQNTSSAYSTPVRNNNHQETTVGFSTPVGQQQTTQLKSPPKLKEQYKEYVTLEDVIPNTMAVPRLGDSPARNTLQRINTSRSNRVPDTQNP